MIQDFISFKDWFAQLSLEHKELTELKARDASCTKDKKIFICKDYKNLNLTEKCYEIEEYSDCC